MLHPPRLRLQTLLKHALCHAPATALSTCLRGWVGGVVLHGGAALAQRCHHRVLVLRLVRLGEASHQEDAALKVAACEEAGDWASGLAKPLGSFGTSPPRHTAQHVQQPGTRGSAEPGNAQSHK